LTLTLLFSQIKASLFLQGSTSEEIILGSDIQVDKDHYKVVEEAYHNKMRNLQSTSVTRPDDWIGVEFAI
jgi:hypothetical protein